MLKSWQTSSGTKITRILSGRSNVFLVSNNGINILVDTSTGRYWEKLDKKLQEFHRQKPDLLILTHSHFDHAANAYKIKEKYGAKVIIHESEAEYLKTGTNPIPDGTNPFTRFIIRLFAKKYLSKKNYLPCEPDLVIGDFFDLKAFGLNANILHTPGHSRGSVSIVVDNEIALVGDTLFGIFPDSVFPPYASDAKFMIESWGKLLETGSHTFLPSHGSQRSRLQLQMDYEKRKSPK